MDSQIDVALHTIVQMAPEHLYYHVKVVEHLVWEPWAAESEAQFAIMIMVRAPFPAPLCCNQCHSTFLI